MLVYFPCLRGMHDTAFKGLLVPTICETLSLDFGACQTWWCFGHQRAKGLLLSPAAIDHEERIHRRRVLELRHRLRNRSHGLSEA